MNNAEFQLRGVGDPRLAVHATSALPAWLWSIDGVRILWANPVGARLFGAANGAVLAGRTFGPADQHRRQIAQLAGRLPLNGAFRLERLRGFGATLGTLVTCGCARLDFADGSHGILVAAAEPVGRAMPLVERLQRLVEGIDTPIAAFARDGMFVGASDGARSLLGFRDLTEAGLDEARNSALKQGRVETPIGIGHLVLQRVGTGADVGLIALIAPGATVQASHPVAPPTPEATAIEPPPQPAAAAAAAAIPTYEQSAISSEAPAEFALVDEFAEEPAEPLEAAPTEPAKPIEATPAEPAPQPTPEYEQPAISGEAPAEFALIDEFAAAPVHESAQHVSAPEQPVSAQHVMPEAAIDPGEPSPEAVAEEPAPAAVAPPAIEASAPARSEAQPARAPSWLDQPAPNTRRHPLRFMWQMDADGRFSLGADEFTRLIGSRTAAGFGRLWSDIAAAFGLDPEGRVLKAVATRETWSGITLNWPVDGGGRLPVELSGLPMFDRARNFAGYRGFGVCRDLDGLARLAALRRYELFSDPPTPQALSAGIVAANPAADPAQAKTAPASPPEQLPVAESPAEDSSADDLSAEDLSSEDLSSEDLSADDLTEDLFVEDLPTEAPPAPSSVASSSIPDPSAPIAFETSHQTDLETAVEPPDEPLKPVLADTLEETQKNVLPFRPIGESKSPMLTPVENSAFNELARQLSARLDSENGAAAAPEIPDTTEAVVDPPAAPEAPEVPAQPQWLAHPEVPARGETRRDKALLDLVPVGVLIYRLDRLLYANTAFLERMGYASLHALEEAGGLDALYVEPGVFSASSTSGTGTPVTISASQASATQVSATQATSEHAPAAAAAQAHLYTISWDDDSALALIFSDTGTASTAVAAAIAEPVAAAAIPDTSEIPDSLIAGPSAVGHANAEELGAILDTTAEGIVMFDAEGNLNSANRSAEALFGYDGPELVQRKLAELFAPESQSAVLDYLGSLKNSGVASLLDQGREVLGHVRGGGLIPLSMTMGRTQADGPNFFAVFRDLSQTRKSESELAQARRLADRAANAKSDMLARISHEVRTPLNAIIGFAEVMIGERFGALNERYVEYMKDIRASGERVIAIINDLLDLSRIETGKLDLAFANQNLNDLVEQCVAVMQPQANRERIIIRTSLAHMLPPVVADARALRQITLNLIGNSIHLANAGGQVIVSTALSDFGEVVLRVRDTGHGLNDNEVAAAMEPFRTPAPSDQASDSSGVSLSLTKALVEANRAQFQIKTGPHSGTLIEVVFAHTLARA
jgi:PAS domain S-box-containing protein